MKLTLSVLNDTFAICRFDKTSPVPEWATKGDFYSITHTDDELSIVCSQENIREVDKIDKGWKALKVKGPLDFSLVGIMANLSSTLANGGVSVFVISTFDTDYILVKEESLKKAIDLLAQAGHTVNNPLI